MNKTKKIIHKKDKNTKVPEKKTEKEELISFVTLAELGSNYPRRSNYPRKTTSLSFYKYIFYIFLIYFLFSIKVWTSAMLQSHGTLLPLGRNVPDEIQYWSPLEVTQLV